MATTKICQRLDMEYFQLSASALQTSKLREAFDQQFDCYRSVCEDTEVDGDTAANVLKQFFRKLTEPLISDDILKLSKESKCVSDENFASAVRSIMETWPVAHRCTLQYLLSFLQLVMRNGDNRMTVTGLSVVFGPNVFRISSGIEGLEIQGLANRAFERLLLTSEIICDKIKDDQGYLNMTSPTSLLIKPSRTAPPIPKQARPLPPPPIPVHSADITICTVMSPPVVPIRSKSLECNLEAGDYFRDDLSCVKPELSDDHEELRSDYIIDETIRHVVRKRLFTPDSSSSSCFDDYAESHDSDDDVTMTSLLPSLTSGRAEGPKNRRKPTRNQRHSRDEQSPYDFSDVISAERNAPVPLPRKNIVATIAMATTQPIVSLPTNNNPNNVAMTMIVSMPNNSVSTSTVTTPDSGCLTAEDDAPQRIPEVVFIPKLNLSDAIEDETIRDAAEVVPPLDLSEVTEVDEINQPLPRQQKVTPTKGKKRRKKGNKSSPIQGKTSNKMSSEPINIPGSKVSCHGDDDVISTDISPKDGSSRWRDAWSTDEETPLVAGIDTITRHDVRFPVEDDNIEMAPSSPNNHYPRHHSHHHHRHHHHHDNHMLRPKINNALKENVEDFDDILASLQEILESLDINRRENGRPEDLTLMTRDQIRLEKLAMQRELLKYEGRHGRPSSKQEKEIMRNVYDRYRTVKRLMADTLSPPFNTLLNRRFDDVEQDYDVNLTQQTDEFTVTQLVNLAPPDGKRRVHLAELHLDSDDHISADLGITELRKQQREAKGQRKRLRRKLRDFEREIEQQHGRAMNQADRVVMATEYSEYRDLKAKLRLLEALIEKHNAQYR